MRRTFKSIRIKRKWNGVRLDDEIGDLFENTRERRADWSTPINLRGLLLRSVVCSVRFARVCGGKRASLVDGQPSSIDWCCSYRGRTTTNRLQVFKCGGHRRGGRAIGGCGIGDTSIGPISMRQRGLSFTDIRSNISHIENAFLSTQFRLGFIGGTHTTHTDFNEQSNLVFACNNSV